MHTTMLGHGNPHDPLGINQYLLNPEDAYRMSLPPPFKPGAQQNAPGGNPDMWPASPSSPAVKVDIDEKPMDSVPYNGEIPEGMYLLDQSIPLHQGTSYKPSTTIEELRRQEIDPRHIIQSPGIHIKGNRGSSPRQKKNFIAMNKMNTSGMVVE